MLFVLFQLRNAMVNHSEGKILRLRMKFHYDDIVSIVHFGFTHQGVKVRTNKLLDALVL
jgi:hypothetical protein